MIKAGKPAKVAIVAKPQLPLDLHGDYRCNEFSCRAP
jgi:hypothetical protein